MDYRKAEMADIQTLVSFRKQQLIDEGQTPNGDIDNELADYFRRCLAEGSLIQYVATANGETVATGGVHFYMYPPSYTNPTGKIAYIASMYTLPAHRGKGIATDIVHTLMDEAHKRGYSRVRLYASEHGRTVYAKLGFEDTHGFMTKFI